MEKYTIEWHYDGFDFIFNTLDTLFSYKQIDVGTIQMIESVKLQPDSKVLDLACGYGVVGIWAAHTIGSERVVMSDINVDALKMAEENVKANNLRHIQIVHSNGFENIHDTDFALVMSNPPYHTDFSVAKDFIEGSHRHLQKGGCLVMVTKRFEWYKNKIKSVFGGVRWTESNGYFVFRAEKRDFKKVDKIKRGMSKKLQRKYKNGMVKSHAKKK